MGVADTETSGQRLESRIGHFIHVTNRTISDGANTAESAVDVAVHLTPKGADHTRLVEVLHHYDLGTRKAGNVAAVFAPCIRIGLPMPGIAWLDDHRHRMADHHAHLRHEVASLLDIEACHCRVMPGDLFPAIVDGGRVPALELEKIAVREATGRIRTGIHRAGTMACQLPANKPPLLVT